MNLSLKNRVAISFAIANIVVFVLGFTVFHFLETLTKRIERITLDANRLSFLTDEIRISTLSILKYQRKVITTSSSSSKEPIDKLIGLCEGFTSQLQTLDTLYKGVEMRPVIAKMLGYIDSLEVILKKVRDSTPKEAASGLESISDLADKILEAFTEFQEIEYQQNSEQDKRIRTIILKTKRNMMYTLIITFVGTMLLGLVVPGKIALPFKKIQDAIRELQECNFDVSIYYDGDDEIGEIAREMNKMISHLKTFEELRADRILIEGRKFDALANMVNKYILTVNAKGELIYMNNDLYSLLQCQSDDILNKNMHDTLIPEPIIETLTLALKRRSKIENAEIMLLPRVSDEGDEGNLQGFKGYATVIPIRAKESSLDYYLMVLSEEVLV